MPTPVAQDLTDGVVSLRKIAWSDAQQLYDWRMDPATRDVFRNSELVPYAVHEKMIQRHLESGSADCWFIVGAERRSIGTISLYGFENDGRTCEWGRFVIEPEFRRKGYGRRALALLLRYAAVLGIEKIYCEVLSTNQAALRLYEEAGFARTEAHDYGGRSFVAMAANLSGRT